MKRIDAVRALVPLVTEEDLFICSGGGMTDDWWNLRPGRVDNTFTPATLGSCTTLALGLALALPHRRVVALDTDGSVLMNLGALATIGNTSPPNLTILVFDNEMYESIGGHPTLTAGSTDLHAMARGGGCPNCATVRSVSDFEQVAHQLLTDDEFGFLVVKIEAGVEPWNQEQRKRADGFEDKYRFIHYVEEIEGIVVHHDSPHH